VRLEPLSTDHDDGLWEASRPPEVWKWVSEQPATRAGFGRYLDAARAATAARTEFAFATIDAGDGRPIGMTRYMALRPDDRGLEIGSTWLTPAAWRTGANIEAKLLQLGYAFETLGCIRVEFKTDARNMRSRTAIARLGAIEEGTLRSKVIMRDGYRRDSVYFSILDSEWPAVKARLAPPQAPV
jgi:N-acetyltransferase